MKKVLLGLIALVAVFIIGVVIAAVTFDPNKYKGQIVTMFEKQTGRSVKLDGPLKLGLSLQGITLSVNNAAIGNPAWASRPQMASIGELDLGIALLPLLDKKLVVTGLKVSKADIQLETNKNGQSNTDFQPAAGATPAPKPAVKAQSSAPPVAISVDQVSVKDSRLAMGDKDGSTSIYNVDSLALDREGAGMAVHFTGSSNGTPVTLDVKTGAANLLTDKNFTFNAEAVYANYKFSGDGKIDLNKKTMALSSYKLDAGHSTLNGALSAGWGGAKSTAQGTAQGDSIDLADFKPPAAKGSEKTTATPAEPGQPTRAFSDAPLNLQGLKSADAHFDIKLGDVKSGDTILKNVTGKVVLVNGTLMVDFPGVQFGGSTMNLKATVDAAAAPVRVEVTFAAPSVDFADLSALAGMKDFITGKANANFSITSAGNSLHEMASKANGSITVISGGGKISSDALQGIYSGLAQLVSAGSGGGDIGFDCLAARFHIKDGVMADNGILTDTTASVVRGSGNINLGAETNDLLINSKPKLAGKYGNLVPPVHIGGTLLKPSYSLKAASVAQNVAGLFMKGGTVTSTVPDVSGPAGQNACVYTLDHPAAAKPAASAASSANTNKPAQATKPADQLKNLGNQLMQGLLNGKH